MNNIATEHRKDDGAPDAGIRREAQHCYLVEEEHYVEPGSVGEEDADEGRYGPGLAWGGEFESDGLGRCSDEEAGGVEEGEIDP